MSMRLFEIAHLEYGQVCEAVGLHPLGSILDGKEVKDGFLESFGFVFETSRPGIIGRCRFAFHTIHLAARGMVVLTASANSGAIASDEGSKILYLIAYLCIGHRFLIQEY